MAHFVYVVALCASLQSMTMLLHKKTTTGGRAMASFRAERVYHTLGWTAMARAFLWLGSLSLSNTYTQHILYILVQNERRSNKSVNKFTHFALRFARYAHGACGRKKARARESSSLRDDNRRLGQLPYVFAPAPGEKRVAWLARSHSLLPPP